MMKIAGKTDIGFSRADNQDAYCGGKIGINIVWASVCDGMGGTYGGDIASALATRVIEEAFTNFLTESLSDEEIKMLMLQTLEKANQTIYEKAQEEEATQGMGTTVVTIVIQNGKAHLAHVGDSRIYLYRNQTLTRETKDHSVVQELIENGTITEKEAINHPRKNMITKVLGVEPMIHPDYFVIDTKENDIFLLCTDGLTAVLSDDELKQLFQRNVSFFNMADMFIDAALEKHTQDNVTTVLLQTDFLAEVE